MSELHPVQAQCELLASAGYMTKTTTEADGATNYGISDAQQSMFEAVLKHPEIWDRSPLFRQCKDALLQMRAQYLQTDNE